LTTAAAGEIGLRATVASAPAAIPLLFGTVTRFPATARAVFLLAKIEFSSGPDSITGKGRPARLLDDKEMLAGVRLQFRDIYRAVERSPDPTRAMESFLGELPALPNRPGANGP